MQQHRRTPTITPAPINKGKMSGTPDVGRVKTSPGLQKSEWASECHVLSVRMKSMASSLKEKKKDKENPYH